MAEGGGTVTELEQKDEVIVTEVTENKLKDRKKSWGKLGRVDSLHLEAGRVSMPHSHNSKDSWLTTVCLAFQSIGVVYGDIGTSPLYVYSSTFTNGIQHQDDILGVLSLIIYTIVLLPMIKYVFIVLRANDNGDGGTFALYSLLCRHVKVSLIPNDLPEDSQVSNYRLELPSRQLMCATKVKEKIEKSMALKIFFFLLSILGTSMVMGDGVLTPSISVLSAVGGITSLGQNSIVGISVAILIALFLVQRFGTDKVGFSFAPIICIWFAFIACTGCYNMVKYDAGVLLAFNPKYMVDYFKRNGKEGWISLGGVVLAITGTEAMFADLGHFNVRAIQISFSCFVFPALLLQYAGQAAYLTKYPNDVSNTFYAAIPGPLYWPQFVVAVAAAIIASQAMISGAFAIISQSLSLGCFPRVKVIHTSAKYEGQVYIPEVNYALMIACVIVTVAFRSTTNIGNAYGICVVAVMTITTTMLTVIMLVVWKTSIWWIILFVIVFGSAEVVYLASVLYKFTQGGYLPFAFALVLIVIMGIWHYVHRARYIYELNNKVSSEFVMDLAKNPRINRIPGMALLYSELVQGIPPIFPHYIANIPSAHSVLVFVSIKSFPISKVQVDERFLFRQVDAGDLKMFRCVVRYGYNDVIEEPHEFQKHLVENLKEFIRNEYYRRNPDQPEPENTRIIKDGIAKHSVMPVDEPPYQPSQPPRISSASNIRSKRSSNRILSDASIESAEEEMEFVQKAMEHGVVYLLGEAEVVARPKSSTMKRFIVNFAYRFLRNNFRQGDNMLHIPQTRMLRVGMTYEI